MYKPSTQPRSFCMVAAESDNPISQADGTIGFTVSLEMDGSYLTRVVATITGSELGEGIATQIQVRKVNVSDSSSVDMLSTPLEIDAEERSSVTAGTAFVVDSDNAVVREGDVLFIDVDQIPDTTAPEGLSVTGTVE